MSSPHVRTEGHRRSRLSRRAGRVTNAVNDALAPLGVKVNTLPISHLAIWEILERAKGRD